jgi:hypothetical protein
MDQSHVRSTKRTLRQKRRKLTIDSDFSANFSTEELNTALLAVKYGKSASFDGVYLEFIKNSDGEKTKEWIVALFNDILTSGKIPKLFIRAKVIGILKPGTHFWPISLLSIVFKILERIILPTNPTSD